MCKNILEVMCVCRSLPISGMIKDYPGSIVKKENELSVIFIGRLHPVKKPRFFIAYASTGEWKCFTNDCW